MEVAVEVAVEGAAVGAEVVGVVGVERLPIVQAAAVEANRPRCAPSEIAQTSKSKQFSTRSR